MTDQDIRQLRSLVPLHTLSEEGFAALTAGIRVEAAKRGERLFCAGDTDHESFYLLDGQLVLKANDRVVEKIAAGSDKARFPIAHELPRKFTAEATSKARFVRIDSRQLSEVLAREHTVDYQVDDLDDESANEDWMTQILHSRVMQQIPPSNIQRVMMKVEQVEVAAGEVVIRQGEPGDYYYMLNRGKAVVSRDPGNGGPPMELARLGPGTSFGEESLLSNSPRNSTITMLTDGLLLRLSKHDFVELIHHPLAESQDFADASRLVEGGAVWLDVRRPEDFESGHLPGSLNLPFESLRYQVDTLAQDRRYVLVSDNGNAAAAAAFFLLERGFDVTVLGGGYEAIRQRVTDSASESGVIAGSEVGADAAKEIGTSGRGVDSSQVTVLEQRISELEAERATNDAERQASLHQLKEAVEKARTRMLAIDQERQAAVSQREELRAEAENARRQLQEARLELDGIRDEGAETEKREQGWKERLRKAEAQGIGERDKAESAIQRLEEVEQQLKAVRRDQVETREVFERQTGELKEELTALQLDLEQERQDHEELQSLFRDKEQELASARQRLIELEQSEKELQRGYQYATTEAASANKQLEELRHTAGNGDAARGQLAAQLNEMEQQLDRRDDDLAARDRALDQSQKELQTLHNLKQDAETELQRVLSRVDVQTRSLASLEQRLSEVKSLHGEAVERGDELAKQLQAKEAEYAQLAQAQAGLEKSKCGLERELAEARETLVGRDAQLEKQVTHAKSACEGLREEKENVLRLLASRDAELVEVRVQLDSLEAQCQVSSAEKAAQQTEIDELQSRIQELQAVVSATKEQLIDSAQSAASVRVQLAEKVAELTTKLEESVAEKGAFKEALAAKNQEVESLRADLRVANRRVEGADATQNKERDEVVAKDAELQSLRQEVAESAEQLRQIETERDEDRKRLEANDRALADERRRWEDSIATLQAQLEEQAASGNSAEPQGQQIDEAELAALREELCAAHSAAEAYHARLDETEKASTKQREDYQKELDELAAQLRASEERIGTQTESNETEVAALRQAQVELRDRIDGVEGEKAKLMEELNTAASLLEEQQADAVREVTELQQQLTHLESAHDKLAGERDTLAKELAVSASELEQVSRLRQQMEEALAAQRSAEQSLAALQQDNSEKAAASQDLKGRLEEALEGAERAEQTFAKLEQALEERDAARNKVEELRALVQTYIDRINTSRDANADEVSSLKTELATVRKQAAQDVQWVRTELEQARSQIKDLERSAGSTDPLVAEALRQEVASLTEALTERQRELAIADKNRQLVEDQLEDAAREIERLKRGTGVAVSPSDDDSSRSSSGSGTPPESEPIDPADAIDELLGKGLPDRPVTPPRQAMEVTQVGGGNRAGRVGLGVLIGLVLVLGGLEAATFYSGRGELFQQLFGGG